MDRVAPESIDQVAVDTSGQTTLGVPDKNAPDLIDFDIDILMDDIQRGLLVPVLGGDINLCGRPPATDTPTNWMALNYAPTTWELALYLLKQAGQLELLKDEHDLQKLANVLITQLGSPQDSMSPICLANVCQYLHVIRPNLLDGLVPRLVSQKYRSTPVHDFLVKLAQYKADPVITDAPYPCIVTTCFDQVLEQQLRLNNVPFHLIAFVFVEKGGVFAYTPPGEDPARSSIVLNKENELELMERMKNYAVIIKLNGGTCGRRDFPIIEDHYIDYLSHHGIKNSLPDILLAKLTRRGTKGNSHLLFLGYSPRHWNLRVILRRIWSESLNNPSKRWTVVMEKRFSSVDKKFWLEYGVKEQELTQIGSLEIYMCKLLDRMASLPKMDPRDEGGAGRGLPGPATLVRDGIFISYSHEDEFWRVELAKTLRPLSNRFKLWDDTKIRPGEEWQAEIEKALASAKAAILLVTPDFLNSDFIANNELPPLLEAAKKGGCRILWINVKQSLVKFTKIGKYQALYDKTPLASLKTEDERGEALHQIGTAIAEIYAGAL
jgi:hypothetical protein